MNQAAPRPRYKFETGLSKEEIRTRIKESLKNPETNPYALQQRSVSGHLIIMFPQKHKHFWSPVMDINMESSQESRTTLRLLMGPEPAIWTMFMFFYAIGGLMILAGIILGYSQFALGHGAWYLLFIPGGLGILGLFYLMALAGKSRARKQMQDLKNFLVKALGPDSIHDREFWESMPDSDKVISTGLK